MKPNVLFFGGRTFNNSAIISVVLDRLPYILGTTCFAVVHGGARGADSLSGQMAMARGLPVIIVNANWEFYGKRAGPIRNAWMLDFCHPIYAVGFPGGVGTADMNRQCHARKIPVWNPL